MNTNPLVAFVQTNVDILLGPANRPAALPLPAELARHFLMGTKSQLLGHKDFVIRAEYENQQMLQQWIRQHGVEEWITIDKNVFRVNEKALHVFRVNEKSLPADDRAQIVNALQRLFPHHLHSTPGKLAMFVMKLRKRWFGQAVSKHP